MNLLRLSFFLSVLGVSGCSAMSLTSGLVERARGIVDQSTALVGLGPNKLTQISLESSSSGRSSAIVIEIAFAYSDAAGAVVVGASESLWFSESKGYCASYASELDVLRIELPAGYSASISDLPENSRTATQISAFIRGLGKADLLLSSRAKLSIVDGALSLEELPSEGFIPGPKINTNIGAITKC